MSWNSTCFGKSSEGFWVLPTFWISPSSLDSRWLHSVSHNSKCSCLKVFHYLLPLPGTHAHIYIVSFFCLPSDLRRYLSQGIISPQMAQKFAKPFLLYFLYSTYHVHCQYTFYYFCIISLHTRIYALPIVYHFSNIERHVKSPP